MTHEAPRWRGTPGAGSAAAGTQPDRDMRDEIRPVGAMARLIAYLIDAVIVAIAIYLVALVLRAAFGPTIQVVDVGGRLDVLVNRPRSIIDAAAAAAITGAYFVGWWLTAGATPGQWLIRARVVDASRDRRLGAPQAIVRWLLLGSPIGLITVVLRPAVVASVAISGFLAVWYLVLFVSTAFDARKRGLHDRIARSQVARRPD